MDCHLVSIEIGVVRGTYQWMQLDRLTLYQDRLKCLNPKSVQGRGTVQHDRMLLDHFFKHIPHLRLETLHHLLRIFYIMGSSVCHKLLHNKRLKQLDRHLLGKAALIDLQFRPHDDNGTSRVVYTLSQQILAEPAVLSL